MKTSKSAARKLVEKLFNPRRINDSALYRLYLRVRHPEHFKAVQRESAFYGGLIRRAGGGMVFDVGANGGSKAVMFKEVAERIICIEPSPAAVEVLEERFKQSSNVVVVAKGVGSESGTLPFHMFGELDCYNTFSQKWAESMAEGGDESGRDTKEVQKVVDVPVTTLDLLIEEFGSPDYVKIDVEGHELEVLKGLSKQVNLVSIECNLPEFTEETLQALTRLDDIQQEVEFNYCVTEPPVGFASSQWLTVSEMKEIVKSGGHTFMEVYCRAV